MSRWGSELDLIQRSRSTWRLHEPLVYYSSLADHLFVVPAEFITDLASVPRLPFAYMITGDRARGPAVIHDWLYQHPDWHDRSLADDILYEAMLIENLPLGFEAESTAIANLIWSGVRAGGWWAWKNNKRKALLNPIWSKDGWPQI